MENKIKLREHDFIKIVGVSDERFSNKKEITNMIGKEVEIKEIKYIGDYLNIKIDIYNGDYKSFTWLYPCEYSDIDSFEVECIDSWNCDLYEGEIYTVIRKCVSRTGEYYLIDGFGDFEFSVNRFINVKNDFITMIERYDKITHNYLQHTDYVYIKEGNVYDSYDKLYSLSLDDMKRCDWRPYRDDYKTNFKIEYNKEYLTISSDGSLSTFKYDGGNFDTELTNNFNIFNDSQYATYLHKKNLLQRKMETFAYLNNEKNKEMKYYISAYLYDNGEFYKCVTERVACNSILYCSTFTSYEIANECLKLYKDDIENVLRLKKELFNK